MKEQVAHDGKVLGFDGRGRVASLRGASATQSDKLNNIEHI